MDAFVSFQPHAHVDQITEDGRELTQLPYAQPFFVDSALMVNELWRDHIYGVIGFAKDLAKQTIDVWWYQLRDEYHRTGDPAVFDVAKNMYLVTTEDPDIADAADRSPRWTVTLQAIDTVTFYPATDEPEAPAKPLPQEAA